MVRIMNGSVDLLGFDADDKVQETGKRIGYLYFGTSEDKAKLTLLGEGDQFFESDTGTLYVFLNGEFVTFDIDS